MTPHAHPIRGPASRCARGLRRAACALAGSGLVAAAVCASPAEVGAPASAAACTADLRGQAADAFWWGDFDALQALYLRSGNGARDVDGRSCSGHVHRGTKDVFNDTEAQRESYHAQLDALTLQWAQAHPKSGYAHALHADSLVSHAWFYRGSGFASSVPAQAWAEFDRYVRRAFEYLAANRDVAITDTRTHQVLLLIARAQGWPQDRQWAVVEDGLRRQPQDDDLYFVMLTNLLPKWGGNPVQVDRYINDVVSRTRAQRGMEFYARLYAAASDEHFEHSLFSASGARWSSMKQGFDDLTRRHPTAWRFNQYAYFACMAQDQETYLVQMEKVGPRPDPGAWGTNAERTIETCRRWGASQ